MIFPPAQIQRVPTPLLWVGRAVYVPYHRPLATQHTGLTGISYESVTVARQTIPVAQSTGPMPVCRATQAGRVRITQHGRIRATVWGAYRRSPVARQTEPVAQNTGPTPVCRATQAGRVRITQQGRIRATVWGAYRPSPSAHPVETACQRTGIVSWTYEGSPETRHTETADQQTAITNCIMYPSGRYAEKHAMSQHTDFVAFTYEKTSETESG